MGEAQQGPGRVLGEGIGGFRYVRVREKERRLQ